MVDFGELFTTLVTEPLTRAAQDFVAYLPLILVAGLVFVVGIAAAKVAAIIVHRLVLMSRTERMFERAGLGFLSEGDIKFSIASLVGRVVWWLVIFLFADFCAGILGWDILTKAFDSVFLYLPRIILALIIFGIAYYLAVILSGLARVRASRIEGLNAALVGRSVKFAILTVGVVMSLEKLGIATTFLIIVFSTIFGAGMLAIAIAFGIGMSDWAKDIVEHVRAHRKERVQRDL
jgi:hypothetical protein